MGYEIYSNYEELFAEYRELALELVEEYGEGEWQEEYIYYFEDVEEFAKYELTDGWYQSLGLELPKDYRGAPDPLDYIDLKKLGEELVRTWDNSINYRASTHEILTVSR